MRIKIRNFHSCNSDHHDHGLRFKQSEPCCRGLRTPVNWCCYAAPLGLW